jgi:hypothetical protein
MITATSDRCGKHYRRLLVSGLSQEGICLLCLVPVKDTVIMSLYFTVSVNGCKSETLHGLAYMDDPRRVSGAQHPQRRDASHGV